MVYVAQNGASASGSKMSPFPFSVTKTRVHLASVKASVAFAQRQHLPLAAG